MTITIFMSILTICIIITSLLTEAIKKAYAEFNKKCSPNLIALINAIFVGCVGTSFIYALLDIPFTRNNVLCMILMAFAIWLGSMLGFDKVTQTIMQIQAVFNISK